ncbi:MAG: IS200/IS605 family transposase [Phycisphaerales bacterium]|nr:IS200/IS605 family transposase [Phycisphaerales bacterium]
MSHDAYFEIYLHITWHTKGDAQLLRGEIERAVHDYIRGRIIAANDCWFDGIGGTDDHIHLIAHVAPTLNVASWIGDLKGASAHHINKEVAGQKLLYWQGGYGVVSFGKKNLGYVLDYVHSQRERHGSGKVIERLERVMMR